MQVILSIISAVAALLPLQISVFNPRVPVILDRAYNIVSEIGVPSEGEATLDEVEFKVSGIPEEAISSVRLMYSGTASAIPGRTSSIGIQAGSSRWGGGNPMWADRSYVIEADNVEDPVGEGLYLLHDGIPLVKGMNYFYVSLEVDSSMIDDISMTFDASVSGATVSGKVMPLKQEGPSERRFAVSVRNHGDDGADSYRIPGL